MSTADPKPLDWSQLYSARSLAAWQVPAASHDDLDNGIFRRPLVRWSELPGNDHSEEASPMWFLCADVLDLDKDVVLDRPAFVFARRIEVSNNAGLILDRAQYNADLLLFAQEVVDKASGAPRALNVAAVVANAESDAVETDYPFRPVESAGATGLSWPAGAAQPTAYNPGDLDPGHLIQGAPLRLSLMTTFQIATLLSTENASLSVSQLRWVASLAQANPDTLDLALQAGSMANMLLAQQASATNALLVPPLDPSIYASASLAFMNPLNQCQKAWDDLQLMKAEDANWAAAAGDSLEQQQNERDLAEKLERKVSDSRQQVFAARDSAAKQVILEKTQVAVCEIQFERGIKRWKEKKQLDEIVKLVLGVFDILKEIPTIVAAGPEFAVLPIVETGTSLVSTAADVLLNRPAPPAPEPIQGPKTKEETKAEEKAAKDAVEEKAARKATQDKLAGSLKNAGSGAKAIYEAAMRISAIAATAQAMESSSREIVNQIGETVGTAFASFELLGLDAVTGGSQDWDKLAAAIDDTFEELGGGVLKDIEGGTAYRLEFRKLIIVGKALSQTRLAVARANSELAEITLRRLAAERAVGIAKQRLEKLDAQIERDQTLAQLAFNKVLDAKRSVYLALETFRRAFLYFTLAPDTQAPTLPRLTESVDKFDTAVAKVSSGLLTDDALARPPQSMPDVHFCLSDPALLSSMQTAGGLVTWHLSPDDTAFHDYGRIRITSVQVFAEGLTSDGPIEVQIATSGVYMDKMPTGGTTREFVSQPMRLNFLYETAPGARGRNVLVKADISPRYAGDFFNPTPFTTWTFRIKRQDGKALDLSAVTGLTIHFLGQVTSTDPS